MIFLILLFFASFLSASEAAKQDAVFKFEGEKLSVEHTRRYITTLLQDPDSDVNQKFPSTSVWLLHAAFCIDETGELVINYWSVKLVLMCTQANISMHCIIAPY